MSDRPNFLLIMTDQQRGDCLGIEGHPALLTPNMDSIAGAGVRFSRGYSTCPMCMPARRSLLSGQFPRSHRLLWNRPGLEWPGAPPTLHGVLRQVVAITPISWAAACTSTRRGGDLDSTIRRTIMITSPGSRGTRPKAVEATTARA